MLTRRRKLHVTLDLDQNSGEFERAYFWGIKCVETLNKAVVFFAH